MALHTQLPSNQTHRTHVRTSRNNRTDVPFLNPRGEARNYIRPSAFEAWLRDPNPSPAPNAESRQPLSMGGSACSASNSGPFLVSGVQRHSITVSIGTERGQWAVVIHPAGVETFPRFCFGRREEAELQACAMIDRWLERHPRCRPDARRDRPLTQDARSLFASSRTCRMREKFVPHCSESCRRAAVGTMRGGPTYWKELLRAGDVSRRN